MEYSFDNDRPIYIQLVEILKLEIVSGKYEVGEKLPSVRDYALDMKVNPNTMQKALATLEREGLIYTERTNGKYVTNDKLLIDKVKDELAKRVVDKFINDMKNIGIDSNKVKDYLKERYK